MWLSIRGKKLGKIFIYIKKWIVELNGVEEIRKKEGLVWWYSG